MVEKYHHKEELKVSTFFEWNCENSRLARMSEENKIKTQKGKKSQPLRVSWLNESCP